MQKVCYTDTVYSYAPALARKTFPNGDNEHE